MSPLAAAPGRTHDAARLPSTPPATARAATGPDVQRLQAQLAARVEGEAGLRGFIEFLRELLSARAVAWLGAPGVDGVAADCVAGAKAGLGAALVGLRPALARDAAAALPAGEDLYHLSTPILREGVLSGWLVAQVAAPNPRDLSAFLALLQAAAGYLLYREQRGATSRVGAVLERASALLEIFRRAGSELDFEKACALAVSALREEFGCERVTLGFRRRGGLRLQTISGVAQLDPKSAAHHPWEAAMQETLASGRIDWTPTSTPSSATAAHELLGQHTGAERLLSLALPHGRGALIFEWKTQGENPLGGAALAEAASGFVPLLFELLERARPHPVLFNAQRTWRAASARKRRFAVAVVGAMAVLLACPFHYTIRTNCRVATVTKRVIAAPFEGVLRHSSVRPGDRVEEGATLGELDNRELKMKEAELVAAHERALKQRDRAMSNSGEGADFATAQVANFEAQGVEQELALVRRKLALLQVTAPLAGVVVSGDLRRAEGQPVRQGEVLWEVAPLDEMIAEVEVPDRDISRVAAGQTVRVRLEGIGGSLASRLERIHPQSEPRDGRNVFICEAPVQADELRPGIRGRAAIESARRPLAWILGHRLWDWAVTTLFW